MVCDALVVRELEEMELAGDFHRDIRGATIALTNRYEGSDRQAAKYMAGFCQSQRGHVGNITAGRMPQDYTPFPHIEWISDVNDRVVIWPEANHCLIDEEGDTIATIPAAAVA